MSAASAEARASWTCRPSFLSACFVILLLLSAAPRADAAGEPGSVLATPSPVFVPDAGPVCECLDEKKSLRAAEDQLKACATTAHQSEQQLDHCNQSVAKGTQELAASRSETKACKDERAALCAASSNIVQAILQGKPLPAGGEECVLPGTRAAVATMEAGWTNGLNELQGLWAFEAGEADRLPRPQWPPKTDVESTIGHLLGEGRDKAPLLYRRMLVEAMKRIAPHYWEQLQHQGLQALNEWFDGEGPLDDALVAEGRRGASAQQGPPGPAGPALVTALKLVQTYLEISGCTSREAPAKGCTRARQLLQLLELSGPLVVERRQQTIWATECSALSPRAVLSWLEELPSTPTPAAEAEWKAVLDATHAKLFACFLSDPTAGPEFSSWENARLPGPELLTGRALDRLNHLHQRWAVGGPEDLCARAVRAMQTLPTPTSCFIPREAQAAIGAWLPEEAKQQEGAAPLPLAACMGMARQLWAGKTIAVQTSFERPPTAFELTRTLDEAAVSPLAKLRSLCAGRRGAFAHFSDNLRVVSAFAHSWGEDPQGLPWRFDPVHETPVEAQLFERAGGFQSWVQHLINRTTTCDALALDAARCRTCLTSTSNEEYDCALVGKLASKWEFWSQLVLLALATLIGGGAIGAWLGVLWRHWRTAGRWTAQARRYLEGLALHVRPDPLRILLPSRFRFLALDLPPEPAWERWGRRAGLVRAGEGKILERDVNEAATVARGLGAEVALLVHDDGASPDLGAVRAILEWAARGGGRGVQVLPVSVERLRWARNSNDLLDLVEQTSLRGNPFEVRGRITSSSQFFNRERLISGLLASIQTGQWTIVTGLRRFGKSSLSLEVARHLNGPSAYIDLAGFHHEVTFMEDTNAAATAILRYICLRLTESARERFGANLQIPPAPDASAVLDSGRLAEWFAELSQGCMKANQHRAVPTLVIFDEIEQAIGVGPANVQRALAVLSIAFGRLRAALADGSPSKGARVGVVLCGSMHPLLWAPLGPLAGQSLMGAFPRIVVPRLSPEAASAMMRGLGARQGIRFTDAALDLIVKEAQGIPLLVRRIGSSVLELYDPERARQGSLGAVEVGLEGASAAVRREEEEGAPLRVWVESEIGDPMTPAGALLRHLARHGVAPAAELRALSCRLTAAHLAESGIDVLLQPDERARRIEEAGIVIIQLLVDTGLIVAEGDLTSPERYRFPDGIVRRILARERDTSPLSI